MKPAKSFIFVLSCFVLSPFATSQTWAAEPVEDSLIYKSVDGKELKIDWTRPADWKATDSRAAVAFMHGGGWVGGAPGQFAPHSVELANRGVVCFRIQYRLLKGIPGPPVSCTEDVSDAFRYIRVNAAKFGIDPNRIAAGGGSAGGHLASFLGMMDDEAIDGVSRKPNALCLFNPVYNNGPGNWGSKRVQDEFKKYSPAHNITKDDPPTLVLFGTKDKLVPVAIAEKFHGDLENVGVRSELYLYQDQPHGFFNQGRNNDIYYRLTVDRMLTFLESLGWFS